MITLFNPYDVALDLKKLRIRVWDPPGRLPLRQDQRSKRHRIGIAPKWPAASSTASRDSIIPDEKNTGARKWFTLLSNGWHRSQAAGNALRLQPGEVKVFSTRVESNWSWSFECANPCDPRAFFDWNVGQDFGNIDNRTNNAFGVEAVPGWDPRAGMQTDHMSYGSGGRPAGHHL